MLTELHLTPRLARVLDAFKGAPGNLLSHEQVGEALYPRPAPFFWGGEDSNVKVAIHHLRKAMRKAQCVEQITTLRRVGYRLDTVEKMRAAE
jgi:DNA-binding response OmpR family regulator